MSSLHLPPSAFPLGSAPRIAVVGGGISGLAAAFHLVQLLPRAEIALFEASDRLGGVLQTVEREGFLIERSADNFLVKPPAGIDLCRQLGIADELLTTDESRRRAFVVRAGQLVPIPEGFYLMSPRKLWPLLASPVLSVVGKLRLLAEPFISRGPAALNPPLDESVAAFARRRLGRETFERLVQPLVSGIYTADPEQLSMAATMPQFLDFERTRGSLLRATLSKRQTGRSSDQSDVETPSLTASGARYGLFVTPRSGMAGLVNALADCLPRAAIHLNTLVTRVTRQADDRWHLDLSSPTVTSHTPTAYDALIVALPAHAAARLIEQCDVELAAELAAIEYAGCAVVSFGFARQQIGHKLDGFGVVVPHVERRRIIAASFASLKFPERAPAESVLIRVFVGGALQPELLDLPDAEISRIALEEIAELLQITGAPLLTDIARWPRSMPQYHVGHLARVSRIEERAALYPNLALAGNAYHGVGIPQCIAGGQSAAERIAATVSN